MANNIDNFLILDNFKKVNLTNYYWYFQSAVPARICDEIVKYGKSISDQMAVTGGFGHGKNLNKKQIKDLNKKEIQISFG